MQKYFIKLFIVGLLFFQGQTLLAQVGLNFQGVARTSNNVILASQPISLRLSILQGTATGSVDYSEVRKVTTNAQGLFAVVIGDADATNILGAFNTINWKNTPKFLKIEMDPAAGNNFTTMGTTQFQYVAYAQYANSVDAGNINGIIPIEKGGTGVASIAALKTALALDKVNNTTDAEKPISSKTQAALDLILEAATDTTRFSNRINTKANITDVSTALSLKSNISDVTTSLLLKENANNKSNDFNLDAASDIKFPTVKSVKRYIDDANVALSNSFVSLTTDQPISGMKTFYNDLKISNVGGIASGTPATINFANGSKIGDIQNISEGSPDPYGSIDLFVPNGASWVQMNYGNFNYIYLTSEAAKFIVGGYRWLFDETGNTAFPGNLKLGATIFPSAPGNNGDVLTFDQGNAVWQAPTVGTGTNGISFMNGVSSRTQSFTTGNIGNDFSIESDINTGAHTFNIPSASVNSRGLLTSADYATFLGKQDALHFATSARDGYLKSSDFSTFSGKQDALTNPVTGTGTSGQLSFFNGTTTLASSPNLMWDATHHRLGIGTTLPGYPVEINTGAANYGLMISSESSNSWGSGIGFKSSTDAVEKTGLFQLDRDGAMVFRTLQDNMYFDNAGSGSIKFRMGDPNASNIGMSLNNSGNLEVTGSLKTGAIIYPNVTGTLGDVLTADASGNPIWHAPTVNVGSSNIDAGTLSGTTLNSTITNSSLTSVGTLANLSVSNPINGNITGNAATVTTNANLTGAVTSVGNVTSIANGAISNNMLANTAVANLSGVNTGDNAVNTRYNGLITDVANLLAANTGDNAVNTRYNNLVTNAVHYGDLRAMITGSDGYYVIGINGTRLQDLQSGILKNTNGTGVPSIAIASDFPTLNQSTTGNAATATKLSTSKNINGVAFDGTNDITIAADAGTLTGASLKSSVINSSLTSVGTLANLTVTNTINGSINGNAASASTANKLTNARNINGTAFDGTSDITITSDAGTLTGTTLKSSVINSSLTSVGTLANLTVTNTINGSINGNAASASTATKLTNARNINGVAFDGTNNITVAASAGTLTGTTLNATVTGSSLTSVGVLNNATVNGKVIVGASSETSASAVLEASSTTQGFLPPRMTIAQRLAIVNPAQGLMIYCTNCGTYGEPQYYNGNSWMNFAGTATSKGTPTITISVGTYTYTGAAQGPTSATNTGTGSTYSFTYVGTGSTTYASSSTKPTNAGTYSVTVSLSASGDGNYNAASASAAFTIAQAIPTVTPTVGTYAYSGSSQGPAAATNTGTGNIYTFSYTGTGITSYGPSTTKPTDGGTYTVIATVAANGNYAASSSSATAFKISLNLAVGNTYGGGKVAYILKAGDIGYDATQQHGLIISGDLTIPDINWSVNNVVTGALGGAPDIDGIYPPADLETGMSNTNIIINSEGSGTNYAAGLARAYTGGGYNNWYLPSASQMYAMKDNLRAINAFTKVHYWTSTEDYYLAAYALYATSGAQVESIDKINTQVGVRAVRSF